MSIKNFIPELWDARIFQAYDNNLVFRNLVNTDYQGEITRFGDTVRINEIGSPTISTYTANASTLSWEQLTDAQKTLTIDKSYSYSFMIDDIDNAQTNPKLMNEGSRKAGVALAETVDADIASLHSQAGTIIGTTDTAGAVGSTGIQKITSTTLTQLLATVNAQLSKHNVPQQGRWIVGPYWFDALVGLSGITKLTDNVNVAQTGYLGRYMGFDIYSSNNVVADSTNYWNIMAGTNSAITYAGQIINTEAVRLQNSFGDGLKGLLVYGRKVIRPTALVKIRATTTEV